MAKVDLYSEESLNKRFPANDFTKKEIKKPTVHAELKKKGFFESLFSNVSAEGLRDSIVFDIVIPTIKQIFMDALRIMLYGNSGGGAGAGYRNYSNPGYVSYGNSNVRYTDISRNRKPQSQRYNSSGYNNDLLFYNIDKAKELVDSLYEILETYGKVRCSDVYDQASVTVDNYLNNDYGWYDINEYKILPEGDKWRLFMPKSVPLK